MKQLRFLVKLFIVSTIEPINNSGNLLIVNCASKSLFIDNLLTNNFPEKVIHSIKYYSFFATNLFFYFNFLF